MTLMPPAGWRCAGDLTIPSAQLVKTVDMPTYAGIKAVVVHTQPRVALTSTPPEVHSICTPLRHSI